MESEQVLQTVGIATEDGSELSNSNISNTNTTDGQHNKNLVMDHIYGASSASIVSPSPSSGSSGIMHASPTPSMSSMRGRSRVWNEFSVTADGKKVTCHRCGDCLAYSNSHSTSSMLKHLKRKHSLDLYPPVSGNDEGEAGGGNTGGASGSLPSDSRFKSPSSSFPSCNSSSLEKRTRSVAHKPVRKHIPKDAEELDTSIQHGPLLFKDPCVRMKWTDHSDTFLRTFSSLYSDECYTDVTLVAEKQFFKAHRVILSSASEFFDESFKMTPAGQHPIIFLKDVKAMDFRILLDFIYKGEVSIPPSLIPGLVKVGSDLRVRGLSDFVWNEQLASSVFQAKPQQQQPSSPPQTQTLLPQNISDPRRFTHQVQQSSQSFQPCSQFESSSIVSSQTQGTSLKLATPVRTLIRQPGQQQQLLTSTQQQQGGLQQPARVYSRFVNIRPTNTSSGVVSAANVAGISSNGFQGQIVTGDLSAVCSTVATTFPSMKRIRIVTSEPRLSPQIRQVLGANKMGVEGRDGGVLTGHASTPGSETVLMVTNEGETLLSTTQGGVTVLAQPSTAMSMHSSASGMQGGDQDADASDPQHLSEPQLRPVITAITSQALQQQENESLDGGTEGDDEVVYSIAEMSDDGGVQEDEILLHQDQEMACADPQEEPVDKKPFLHG